jgi:hypothetical protein
MPLALAAAVMHSTSCGESDRYDSFKLIPRSTALLREMTD